MIRLINTNEGLDAVQAGQEGTSLSAVSNEAGNASRLNQATEEPRERPFLSVAV
jgi:hypothetical protein